MNSQLGKAVLLGCELRKKKLREEDGGYEIQLALRCHLVPPLPGESTHGKMAFFRYRQQAVLLDLESIIAFTTFEAIIALLK